MIETILEEPRTLLERAVAAGPAILTDAKFIDEAAALDVAEYYALCGELEARGFSLRGWKSAVVSRRSELKAAAAEEARRAAEEAERAAEEEAGIRAAEEAERLARERQAREAERQRILDARPELARHYVSAERDGGEFVMQPGVLVHRQHRAKGPPRETTLLKASVSIVRHVTLVGATDRASEWELEAIVGDDAEPVRFSVQAQEFAELRWVASELGPRAAMAPGARELLRCAVESLSPRPERAVVYGLTGWVRHEGRDVYAHAGGGIGARGPVEALEVRLPAGRPELPRFALPEPPTGQALIDAVRASRELLRVGPPMLGAALLGLTYRAALGRCPATLYLSAPQECGKSTLAALAQAHYGRGFDAKTLPVNLSSVASDVSVTALRGIVGDALFVVDDYRPTGAHAGDAKLDGIVDRLVRSQHDGTVRAAATRNGGLRAATPVRSSLVITGEALPRGHSLRTRCLVVQLEARVEQDLGPLEAQGRDGVFSLAMAGFIHWLARDLAGIRQSAERAAAQALEALKRREVPDRAAKMVAEIAAGIAVFGRFAREAGAITPEEHAADEARATEGLTALALAQAEQSAEEDPALRFLALVSSGLAAGRFHVVDKDENRPKESKEPEKTGGWGWRRDGDTNATWRPQGPRIGWLEDEVLYLLPTEALIELRKAEAFPIRDASDLGRRLKALGALAATDEARGTNFRRKHGHNTLAIWKDRIRPSGE